MLIDKSLVVALDVTGLAFTIDDEGYFLPTLPEAYWEALADIHPLVQTPQHRLVQAACQGHSKALAAPAMAHFSSGPPTELSRMLVKEELTDAVKVFNLGAYIRKLQHKVN